MIYFSFLLIPPHPFLLWQLKHTQAEDIAASFFPFWQEMFQSIDLKHRPHPLSPQLDVNQNIRGWVVGSGVAVEVGTMCEGCSYGRHL